jgi:hypothetical protein
MARIVGTHICPAGTAGNQVLEWVDLDSEIKTVGLKDVSDVSYLNVVLR